MPSMIVYSRQTQVARKAKRADRSPVAARRVRQPAFFQA